MSGTSDLNLERYYPTDMLKINGVVDGENEVRVQMRSITRDCVCPKCGTLSHHCHGTYSRRVKDLPIMGKQVILEIRAREYQCDNPQCDVNTMTETYDGFLDEYSRMTSRCEDFICTLALESSCEGCARICKMLGLRICGDTVINLLLRSYKKQPSAPCGCVVGVDDFAFKKRHKYGTIIVDEKTHHPVAILDGRDGAELKEWLKENMHVRAVTRDRASAYTSAIEEILPDAMQIADRFHLHQNLLDAVRTVLNANVPANLKIPKEGIVDEINLDTVDNRKGPLKKRLS